MLAFKNENIIKTFFRLMLKYTNTDAILNVFFRKKRNQYRRQRDKKKKQGEMNTEVIRNNL